MEDHVAYRITDKMDRVIDPSTLAIGESTAPS